VHRLEDTLPLPPLLLLLPALPPTAPVPLLLLLLLLVPVPWRLALLLALVPLLFLLLPVSWQFVPRLLSEASLLLFRDLMLVTVLLRGAHERHALLLLSEESLLFLRGLPLLLAVVPVLVPPLVPLPAVDPTDALGSLDAFSVFLPRPDYLLFLDMVPHRPV
jgi:hypothetical protein